jgi:hypothetical protein
MARATPILTNETAGEMSPLLAGRVDLAKYHNTGEIVRNMIIRTQGPLSLRPGSEFIAPVKTHSKRVRLIDFQFSATQAYSLEFGDQYIRFYMNKGQILDGAAPYEIVSPYLEAELREIRFIQSADVMYLCHPNHAPRQLSRTGHTAWILTELVLQDGPYLEQNTGATTLTPSAATGDITLTATDSYGPEMVTNGDFAAAVSWIFGAGWTHDAVNLEADHAPGSTAALEQAIGPGAGKSYRLTYKIKNHAAGSVTPQIGGVNGVTRSADGTYTETIVATTAGNLKFIPNAAFDGSIDDVSVNEILNPALLFQAGHVGAYFRLAGGYVQITGVTGPYPSLTASATVKAGSVSATAVWREGAFSAYRGFPAALCFYEQRLYFAGTPHKPQTIWGSKTADYPNFAPQDTITDDGPVTYTIPSHSGQINIIKWLASGRTMLVGTVNEEISLFGGNDTGLTPSNPPVMRGNTFKGSATVPQLWVGNAVLFVERHGRKVRELAYSFADDAYTAPDLAIWSEHITESGIVEVAYQRQPDQTLWAVRADGVLLSMVYERSQEVVGWSRHDTDGLVESVACIPGVNQTEVWLAVKRTINGQIKRYIECFRDVDFGADQKDAFFVDCGLTYEGAPATVISGLDHLEAKEVAILADGAVHVRRTVASGQITLLQAASKVQVGLPYRGQFLSPRIEAGATDGTAQGKIKRIDKLTLRLYRSGGGQAGPDLDNLEPLIYRQISDPMDTAVPLFTGDQEIDFRGDYEREGRVMIIQDDPLPLTICALIPRVSTFEG